MTGRVRLGAQVMALGCVAGLLALLVWKLAHQQHAPKVGSTAPTFSLERVDGRGGIALKLLRGRGVVLNFWASWCKPCKAEARVLEREWLRYRSRGVIFVGIDYHDLSSEALKFIAAHGLTFPMLKDGSGNVTASYGISQVPETYVLDATGKIVAHFAGPVTDSTFAAKFAAALREIS